MLSSEKTTMFMCQSKKKNLREGSWILQSGKTTCMFYNDCTAHLLVGFYSIQLLSHPILNFFLFNPIQRVLHLPQPHYFSLKYLIQVRLGNTIFWAPWQLIWRLLKNGSWKVTFCSARPPGSASSRKLAWRPCFQKFITWENWCWANAWAVGDQGAWEAMVVDQPRA